MDFKQFIPDFGAIAKTEWGKPQWGGKQDVIKLIGIIATFAMLTFVLMPWFGVDYSDETLNVFIMKGRALPDLPTRAGITTWCGFLGFTTAVAALFGFIYNHKAIALWASALCIFFGFCGFFVYTSLDFPRLDRNICGEMSKDEIKFMLDLGVLETVRWGAVMYFIAALHATAAAFAGVIGFKFKK
jgi:hypothetical protein